MAKTKFSTRILNAYRALRGEPWPIVIEGPKIKYYRPAIQTIVATASLPEAFLRLQGTEVTDKEARRNIATKICNKLLDDGAIEIVREVERHGGWLYYTGRVRVVMPEKEDDSHGQE